MGMFSIGSVVRGTFICAVLLFASLYVRGLITATPFVLIVPTALLAIVFSKDCETIFGRFAFVLYFISLSIVFALTLFCYREASVLEMRPTGQHSWGDEIVLRMLSLLGATLVAIMTKLAPKFSDSETPTATTRPDERPQSH